MFKTSKNKYNDIKNYLRIEHHYPNIILYINNNIVGILEYKKIDKFYIQLEIFQIDQEYSGKGYAHLLIDYLKIIAKETGYNMICVTPTPYTYNNIINPKSRTEDELYKIYEKLGFRKNNEDYPLFPLYKLLLN